MSRLHVLHYNNALPRPAEGPGKGSFQILLMGGTFPRTVGNWSRGSRKSTDHNPTSPASQGYSSLGCAQQESRRLVWVLRYGVAVLWLSTTPKIRCDQEVASMSHICRYSIACDNFSSPPCRYLFCGPHYAVNYFPPTPPLAPTPALSDCHIARCIQWETGKRESLGVEMWKEIMCIVMLYVLEKVSNIYGQPSQTCSKHFQQCIALVLLVLAREWRMKTFARGPGVGASGLSVAYVAIPTCSSWKIDLKGQLLTCFKLP
jgi:hypothetical protein